MSVLIINKQKAEKPIYSIVVINQFNSEGCILIQNEICARKCCGL